MKRAMKLGLSLLLFGGTCSLYAASSSEEEYAIPNSTDTTDQLAMNEDADRRAPPRVRPRPRPQPGHRPQPGPGVHPRPRPHPGPVVHPRPPHTGGHVWPNRHHNWNYYRWHFNPLSHPWYWYGYARYPRGYYPGYQYGYYYYGSWLCTGYDDDSEDHDGGHRFRSTDYGAAYDAALNACQQLHGQDCVVSCMREQ